MTEKQQPVTDSYSFPDTVLSVLSKAASWQSFHLYDTPTLPVGVKPSSPTRQSLTRDGTSAMLSGRV